jgi:tetrahydromethanopterin S-methyltransferase subunit D
MEHSANIEMMKMNHETLLILESFAGSCGAFIVAAVEVIIDMVMYHWGHGVCNIKQ